LLAPLHHDIADSPTDGRAYWAKTSDGIRIRFAIWDGSQNYVLIFPGRTEYIEKYAKTGHVEDYDDYQKDLKAVLSTPQIQELGAKFHLLSHSMGGLIALRTIHDGMDIQSCVFSAPMWGMGLAPPIRDLLKHFSKVASLSGFGKIKVLGSKRGSYIKEADPPQL